MTMTGTLIYIIDKENRIETPSVYRRKIWVSPFNGLEYEINILKRNIGLEKLSLHSVTSYSQLLLLLLRPSLYES